MQVFQRQSKSTLSTHISEKSSSLYMQSKKSLLKMPQNYEQKNQSSPSSPLKDTIHNQLKQKKDSFQLERKSLKLMKQSSVWKSKKGKIENQYNFIIPQEEIKDKVFHAFLACENSCSSPHYNQKFTTSKQSFLKSKQAYQKAISRNKMKIRSRDMQDNSKFCINIRDLKIKNGKKSRNNQSLNCNVVNLFRSLQQSIKPIHKAETSLQISNKQNRCTERLKIDKAQPPACNFVPLKMPSFVGTIHKQACYIEKISMTEQRNYRISHKTSEKQLISSLQYGLKLAKKGVSSYVNESCNQFEVNPWSTHQITID